ncbi:MAG: DUF779 domain-containing protein [Acidobacteria bacterium]|nr:DUF779 domain-containing protein [Acidobacteriota bacterium]
MEGETTSRVALTPAAVELLELLWERHGPLMFHQSGGCCDGSSPMCFPAGEFITAEADVLLGRFELGTAETSKPLEFWIKSLSSPNATADMDVIRAKWRRYLHSRCSPWGG